MTAEDAYYFRHHDEELSLPAYRLVLNDVEGTRYYLDAVSAEILAKVERRDKAFRWLHQGLHRLDAWRCLRTRPAWDIVVLLLLSCATAGSVTGLYVGFQRLFRRR